MKYNRDIILNWYIREGKLLIEKLAPNLVKFIEQYSEKSGVYKICFNKIPVYIGESKDLAFRFITHFYNLLNEKTNWGIQPSHILEGKVRIDISILYTGIIKEVERKKLETQAIIEMSPLLQSKIDKYYPYDKCKKESENGRWITRDEIDMDWCIRSAIREEVVLGKLGFQNQNNY